MDVNVTVTLSDRLFALLEGKLPNLGAAALEVKETPQSTAAEASVAVKYETPTAPQQYVAPAEPAQPTAPTPSAQPTAAAQPEAKQPTLEDVREAMRRTHVRFEGEDYRDTTDSEAYRRHHKRLISMFKHIAALLGAEKPSALSPDKYGKFISECDQITVNADGDADYQPSPF